MILTGNQIEKERKAGRITIEPFECSMVNPNSYNYRLAETLYKVKEDVIDSKKPTSYEKIVIPKEGYVLQPGILYLGSTMEVIGSDTYSMQLIGRSSVGRLGLFLQVSAPLGHIGTSHCWTLELKSVQPLRVYPRMKIGQVSFWCVSGENNLTYDSKYWKYTKPHISEIYREFNQEGDGK